MKKAYKYRIYPNDEQKVLLDKTFGCVRFVYNRFLHERIQLYKNANKYKSWIDCINDIVDLKKSSEFEWLKEVDSTSLLNSMRHLESAYKNFFREIKNGNTKQGFPKFKSKHTNKRSYQTNSINNNIKIDFENNKIKLPKLKWIKAAVHRELPDGKIVNATISQSPSGKYHVSICFDTGENDTSLYLPISQNEVGIDVGIKDVVTTSDGVVYENKKLTKKYEYKLTKEQRRLSKKKKGSSNRNKQRIKVARVHEKISNIRKDYLHKISKQLINENQVIMSEDLDVKKMVQDKKFSKSISDVGWSELFRQLEYKAKWYNRTYHKVDRYFPSSQMCSNCKSVNTEMKDLSIRTWTCKNCSTFHLRDKCAADNMKEEGQRELALIQ